MESGYRSITKDDIRQEGDEVLIDQYFTRPFFRKIPSFCLGDKYKKFELTSNEYRRPIAQDEPHYSSDIKPVIDQLSRSEDYNVSRYLRSFCGPGMFDACANNKEDVAAKPEPPVNPEKTLERAISKLTREEERQLRGAAHGDVWKCVESVFKEYEWSVTNEYELKLAVSYLVEAASEQDNPQEWDGTGLPPVGVECLVSTIFFTVNLRRETAIVKFYGRNIVVFECKNDEYVCKLSEAVFHQIKTPAQLAEEKEAEELQCEVDMLKAWLEQEDLSINVLTAGVYVQQRLKESGND